jgi:peptidoglycan/LPS O-acetylase OafA/YrhL
VTNETFVSPMTTRSQSVDVLRGVAVLMVIVDHYSVVIKSNSRLLETFGRGVDLFFVLSGFLISGLLFSEYKNTGSLNLWRFWIRRGFKIYPPFYGFLFVTGALGFMTGKEFLNESGFLQGYFSHFWIHTWSLAVEEHFYFSLPILLLLLLRVFRNSMNPFRLLPLISILISGICFYMRVMALNRGAAYGIATHLRIDALFAGVTLGYFWHFDPESFSEARSKWALISGVFVALLLPIMPTFLQMTFAYIAFCLIVAWAVNLQPRNGYISPVIAFIGRHSYSIYLWHALIALWMARLAAHWFSFPAYAGMAILLGVLMSKVIEIPSLEIRDRLFPSVGSTANKRKVCSTFATPETYELTT